MATTAARNIPAMVRLHQPCAQFAIVNPIDSTIVIPNEYSPIGSRQWLHCTVTLYVIATDHVPDTVLNAYTFNV